MHVLLVEPDPVRARMAMIAFAAEDFEVGATSTGTGALRIIRDLKRALPLVVVDASGARTPT